MPILQGLGAHIRTTLSDTQAPRSPAGPIRLRARIVTLAKAGCSAAGISTGGPHAYRESRKGHCVEAHSFGAMRLGHPRNQNISPRVG